MATEIELKFLISPEVAQRLPALLQSYSIQKHDQLALKNTYFDTPDLALGNMKAGLRIRSHNGLREQTVKLAGRQVGGLHQRPEYNVPITDHVPDLLQFPVDIWPKELDLVQLQAQLTPLFSTDFIRKRWLVELEGSHIELALDEGAVKAGSLSTPIHELELELASGDMAPLFTLAFALIAEGGMRLGAVSKAQRGYQLAGLTGQPQVKQLASLLMQPNEAKDNPVVALLHLGLDHWQHHEETWLADPNLGADWLRQLSEGVSLVRQALLPLSSQPRYQVDSSWLSDLSWVQQQVNEHSAALDNPALQRLFYSYRYTHLVLALTYWLAQQS